MRRKEAHLVTNWIKTKAGFASIIVAGTILAGSIATASADKGNMNNGNGNGNGNGYAQDQCANGNWQNFKNPDGSQKFKNQGQCIKFFHQSGGGGNNGNGGNNNNHHHYRNAFAQFFGNFWGWWHNFR